MQRRSFVTAVLTGIGGLFGVRQVAKAEDKKAEKWCVEILVSDQYPWTKKPLLRPSDFCCPLFKDTWTYRDDGSTDLQKEMKLCTQEVHYGWVAADIGTFDSYDEADKARVQYDIRITGEPTPEQTFHVTEFGSDKHVGKKLISRVSRCELADVSADELRRIAEKGFGLNQSL